MSPNKSCGDPNCIACAIVFSKKRKRKSQPITDYSAENLDKIAFARMLNKKFDELLAIQQVMRLRRQKAERMRRSAK